MIRHLLSLKRRLHKWLDRSPWVTRFRILWSALALAGFSCLVCYAVYRIGYVHAGLSATSLDQAQLARNIVAGKGFYTSILRPNGLPFFQPHGLAPDFSNAPLYPLLLALAFAVLGPHDGVITLFTLGLHGLTIVLLFLLATRLAGTNRWAALLTVLVYALSQPVLVLATSGTPLVLSSCLLMALLLALTPQDQSVGATTGDGAATAAPKPSAGASDAGRKRTSATPQRDRSLLIAGVLAGLCYLTDYLSLAYVIPLAIYWVRASQGWDRAKALSFATGLVVVALPWWIRNTRLTGNPLYSFQWLELATRTDGFPGLSLYRDLRDNVQGAMLLAPGLIPFIKKLLSGLTEYFFQAPLVPHLYLAPFVIVAFWQRSTNRLVEACKWGTLAAWLLYGLALICYGRVGVNFLVPLAPLVSLIGVLSLLSISKNWVNRWVSLRSAAKQTVNNQALYRIYAAFGVAVALFLLFPLAPLAKEVWRLHQQPDAAPDAVAQIVQQMPAKRLVVTDVPWLVAWYGRRIALWIPTRMADLSKLEAREPVGGIYLSPALRSYGAEENVAEWQQAYAHAGEIPGYRTVGRTAAGDVVYLKYASLAEAEKLVWQKPRDANALADLGRALLAEVADVDRALVTAPPPHQPLTVRRTLTARRALAAFKLAQQLSPRAAGPYRGLGLAYVRLGKFEDSAKAFERALDLDPGDLPSKMGLGDLYFALHRRREAIDMYERVLADYPNYPLAVNNLAYLYAEDNRDLNRALEMGRRSVAANPQNAMMWDTLGWVAYRLRRTKEAVSYLEAAGHFAPRNPLIYYHLGRAYAATGQRAKAADVLQVALSGKLSAADHAAAEATFLNLR